MGAKTDIQWTHATWNPVRGCSRVSEGCRNCYAERQALRFSGQNIGPAEFTARKEGSDLPPFYGFVTKVNGHASWTGRVELVEKHLMDPFKWKEPRRIFVNSMSDLFHENLSTDSILMVFKVMQKASWHTFQVLTKRPHIMQAILSSLKESDVGAEFPLPNVWLGVSCEDQPTADERIPLLLQTPAAVRFVSYEPALGPVDFRSFFYDGEGRNVRRPKWIIVGGESGPGARPFDIAWARNTIAQCKAAAVPCFVKQLGSAPHSNADKISHRGDPLRCGAGFWRFLNDRKGGNCDEWPSDLRVREFPA